MQNHARQAPGQLRGCVRVARGTCAAGGVQLQQFARAGGERASSQWASARESCCSSGGTAAGRVGSDPRAPTARAAASPAKARALAQSIGPNGALVALHYTRAFENTRVF